MNYKNIFLFGAGASHGCNGVNKLPPLGTQLFDCLKKEFPLTWGKLPGQLNNAFNTINNFEYGMSKLWEDNTSEMLPLKSNLLQDMGIYFSRFDILDPSANLYVKLIKNVIKKEQLNKTLFSTINYECLMEIAFQKAGVGFNIFEISEYERIKLLKLHGSCNFALQGVYIGTNAYIGSNAVVGKGPAFTIKALHPSKMSEYFVGKTSLYPVMAIYVKNKPIQLAQDIINNVVKIWQEQILAAENIFVIGVSPNMEDKHIWDFISQTEAKVFYCGGEKGFEDWESNIKRKDSYLSETFDTAVDRILEIL